MADISDLLEDVGLDPDYWKSMLKNHLGLVNRASFKHLDPDSAFNKLRSAECIRHDWEAVALMDLFTNNGASDRNKSEGNQSLNQGQQAAREFTYLSSNAPINEDNGEIAEYNMLENEFQKLAWELRQCAVETEESNKNRIVNNKDVSESSIEKDVLEKMQGKFCELFAKLEQYFNEENRQTVQVQWRGSTEKKLKDLKEDLVTKTNKKCVEYLRMRKSRLQLDLQNEKYEQELIERSKKLAVELKEQAANEATIEKEFKKLWQDMLATIPVESHEKTDILCEIQNILMKCFEKQYGLVEFLQQYKETFIVDTEKHVSRTLQGLLSSKEQHKAEIERQVQWIQQNISEYVSTKEGSNADYSPQFVYEIIKRVQSYIGQLNKDCEKRDNFKLSNQFTFELTAHVCLNLAGRFTQMRAKYLHMNSPKTHFDNKRGKYYTIFKMCLL